MNGAQEPRFPFQKDQREQVTVRRELFGTDGVRGRANAHPITASLALSLGQAAGRLIDRGGRPGRVVIGKDTRLSGYMLESALEAGLTSTGMEVLLLGPLPTPAVGMLTRSLRADLGVMISASHNPYEDNGIKFFGPDGFKLSDADEARIEALMREPPALAANRAASIMGAATAVGLLTGFFGVGGGFAVVPALVIALGFTMREAVATSLLVLTLNTASALVARAFGDGLALDWSVIAPFTVATVLGSFVGARLGPRLPDRLLQRSFAILLVGVGVYTAWQSLT